MVRTNQDSSRLSKGIGNRKGTCSSSCKSIISTIYHPTIYFRSHIIIIITSIKQFVLELKRRGEPNNATPGSPTLSTFPSRDSTFGTVSEKKGTVKEKFPSVMSMKFGRDKERDTRRGSLTEGAGGVGMIGNQVNIFIFPI